jgi:hypothetical protein
MTEIKKSEQLPPFTLGELIKRTTSENNIHWNLNIWGNNPALKMEDIQSLIFKATNTNNTYPFTKTAMRVDSLDYPVIQILQ